MFFVTEFEDRQGCEDLADAGNAEVGGRRHGLTTPSNTIACT